MSDQISFKLNPEIVPTVNTLLILNILSLLQQKGVASKDEILGVIDASISQVSVESDPLAGEVVNALKALRVGFS